MGNALPVAVGGFARGGVSGLGVPVVGSRVLLAVMGVATLAGSGVALSCSLVWAGDWEESVGLDPLAGLSAVLVLVISSATNKESEQWSVF